MQNLRFVFVFFLTVVAGLAGDLRVATLNCFLLFDPAIEHRGKLDEQSALSPEQYQRKVENLSSLVKDYAFVGLQETGGRAEIEALAKVSGARWAFAKGKDTYTGQEVGALYKMPGWDVTVNGRVGELDAVVSKHLLVTARRGTETVKFLVVHLIRPIGQNAEKQQRQLASIAAWAKKEIAAASSLTVVVLGDFNYADARSGQSPLGIGAEVGELNGFLPTHLAGKPFDRMISIGGAKWTGVEIARPPYGKKPNDLNKSLWTDHFLLGGVLTFKAN